MWWGRGRLICLYLKEMKLQHRAAYLIVAELITYLSLMSKVWASLFTYKTNFSNADFFLMKIHFPNGREFLLFFLPNFIRVHKRKCEYKRAMQRYEKLISRDNNKL